MVKLCCSGTLETLLIIGWVTLAVTGQDDDVHIFFTLGGKQNAQERTPFGQMNPQFNQLQSSDFSKNNIMSQTQEQEQPIPPPMWKDPYPLDPHTLAETKLEQLSHRKQNTLSQTQEQEQLIQPPMWINPKHPLAETDLEKWSHRKQKDDDDNHIFFNFRDTQNADQMSPQSNRKLMGPVSSQNFKDELGIRFQTLGKADEMTPPPQYNKKLTGPLSSQDFRRDLARRFKPQVQGFNKNPVERGQMNSNRGNVQAGILSKLTAVETVLQQLKEEVRNEKNKNGRAEDYPNLTPKLNQNKWFAFGAMNSLSRKEKNQTNHKQENKGMNTPNTNGKNNQQSEKMENVSNKGFIPTNQTKSSKSNLTVPFKEVFHRSEAQSDENFVASMGKNKTAAPPSAAAQAKQSLASPKLNKKVKSE